MRIGPRMRAVRSMVERLGAVAVIDAAREVGPHGSLCYGYATVGRAIRAGMVRLDRTPLPGRRGSTLRPVEVAS